MKLCLEVNVGTPDAPDWRRIPDVPNALIRPAILDSNWPPVSVPKPGWMQ